SLLIAKRAPVRVADLTGDLPAVLGMPSAPTPGLFDWLRAGPHTPADAIDRFGVDVARRLVLLPAGEGAIGDVAPECGAALAVALQHDDRITVCDAGRLDRPAQAALAEIADTTVMVVRGCYLALRNAVHHEGLGYTSGVVLIDEHGRSLGARDVEDVLGLPVLATIEARVSTARAVDAGTIVTRMPDALGRPLRHAL